jgi:threonylcarbamoyladenosine tRNA methylthiotransferase MtaB
LLPLWKNPRLCPHFHISVQSGSDRVLESMKRRYSVSSYAKAVSMIREVLPDAAVTTDIIVGFPGETDDDFQQSGVFCRRMGFARIHVFPFSPRPGTAAADMPGQIGARLKKERSVKMLALAKESTRVFLLRFMGGTMEVLWEQQSDNGVWSGYTPNYIRVYARSDQYLTNVLTAARLVKLYRDGYWGEISNLEKNE